MSVPAPTAVPTPADAEYQRMLALLMANPNNPFPNGSIGGSIGAPPQGPIRSNVNPYPPTASGGIAPGTNPAFNVDGSPNPVVSPPTMLQILLAQAAQNPYPAGNGGQRYGTAQAPGAGYFPPQGPYLNDSPIGAMGGQQVQTAPFPTVNPLYSDPVLDPYRTSGLPINEMAIATPLYENPAFAIDLTGAAQAGTPGYYNLANATPDADGMQALFLAIMGHAPTSPTEYLNFLNNYYATLGTVGSQGGGTLNVAAVMGSLVNAKPGSQLATMIADDASVFYSIASDALQAGGASPIAQQGLQSQMMQLYQDYFNYAATSDANATQPFNVWLQNAHPDVVASWIQGG